MGNKILLDSNVILRYPELLGMRIKGYDIIVLSEIIQEIVFLQKSRKDEIKRLVEYIHESNRRGLITITDSARPELELEIGKYVNEPDRNLIEYSRFLIEHGSKVFIATDDKRISNISILNNIPVLNLKELKEKIKDNDVKDEKVYSYISKYQIAEVNFFVGTILKAIAIFILGFLVVKFFEEFIKTVNNIFVLIVLFLLAIMAFVIRQKQRFLYGLIELIAGLSAIMFTLIEVDIIEKLNLSFFLKSLEDYI